MNDMLKIIFDELIIEKDKEFVPDEMNKQIIKFINDNFSDTDDEFEDIYVDFYDIIWNIQEKAFEVGFYTAVELLTRNTDEIIKVISQSDTKSR